MINPQEVKVGDKFIENVFGESYIYEVLMVAQTPDSDDVLAFFMRVTTGSDFWYSTVEENWLVEDMEVYHGE
ncbi:hypothetical protein Goe5_c01140 [Bacillus phage vB_BthM-Goe5]|nr:hypothetical protein Goe5_c01140 [Bacillus phage vB_BthM-Goe5]